MDPGRNRGNPLKPTCGSHSPESGPCWVMVHHDRALRRSPWPGFCRLPLREAPSLRLSKTSFFKGDGRGAKGESIPCGQLEDHPPVRFSVGSFFGGRFIRPVWILHRRKAVQSTVFCPDNLNGQRDNKHKYRWLQSQERILFFMISQYLLVFPVM